MPSNSESEIQSSEGFSLVRAPSRQSELSMMQLSRVDRQMETLAEAQQMLDKLKAQRAQQEYLFGNGEQIGEVQRISHEAYMVTEAAKEMLEAAQNRLNDNSNQEFMNKLDSYQSEIQQMTDEIEAKE